MQFVMPNEERLAKELDFIVRGVGRGARLMLIEWTRDAEDKKTLPVCRNVRPASNEEVRMWRALSLALVKTTA